MDTRPAAHRPPPPDNVDKADPDPVAVEFLGAELPVHVQAFLAEVTTKAAGDAAE